MKLARLIFFFSLVSSSLFAQQEKYTVNFSLVSIRFMNDNISKADSAKLDISFDKNSGITPFYTSAKYVYGVNFRIVDSLRKGKQAYFVAVSFYYKKDGNWIFIATDSPPGGVWDDVIVSTLPRPYAAPQHHVIYDSHFKIKFNVLYFKNE